MRFAARRTYSGNTTQRCSIAGFTLIELLVAFGIFAITTSLIGLALIRPQTSSSLNATINTLMVDIKNQQAKAMNGDSQGAASAAAHGLYFQSSSYTLFKGVTYAASEPDNFLIDVTPVTIATTLPSGQLSFQRLSGEPANYTEGNNTVTISNGGESKTITINRYGALTVN